MLILVSIVVQAIHLLAMNLATAGSLLVIVLQRGRRRGDESAGRLATRLAGWSNVGLLVGTLFGAIMAWLAWIDHGPYLQAAFELLPMRRYAFGAAEIVFSLACMEVVRRMCRNTGDPTSSKRHWTIVLLSLAAGSNLAYHFPPLFSMLGVFSARPERWGQPISFLDAIADAEVIGLWVHFLLASATVGGLTLSWLASQVSSASEQESTRSWTVFGGRVALVATILQLLSGLHLLAVLGEPARDAMLGGDMAAVGCFMGGMIASVALLHRLAAVALGEPTNGDVKSATVTLVLVVVLMTGMLQTSRQATYRLLPEPARQTSER